MSEGMTEKETLQYMRENFKRAASNVKAKAFGEVAQDLKQASSAINHLGVIQQKTDLCLLGAMVTHLSDQFRSLHLSGLTPTDNKLKALITTLKGIWSKCDGIVASRSVSRSDTLTALRRQEEGLNHLGKPIDEKPKLII